VVKKDDKEATDKKTRENRERQTQERQNERTETLQNLKAAGNQPKQQK
jgi:hypothetical protein